jgi:hypothetical protein
MVLQKRIKKRWKSWRICLPSRVIFSNRRAERDDIWRDRWGPEVDLKDTCEHSSYITFAR